MKKILSFIIILLCVSGCTKLPESKGNPTFESNENVLTVHYLDIGQGDSIVAELPNKELLLIDAGEASSSEKIISYIKNLGYSKIDYVIGTHPHADHIGGLANVIKSFDIGSIYMPKVAASSKTYENLLNTIKDKNLKIKTGKNGVEVLNENNLVLKMVAPNQDSYSSYNNYSIVLRLDYGTTSFLFTGDAEEKSEKEITEDVNVDVLKVGHHGSDTSSSEEFLAKVKPKYAIISVGAGNKYGHPADITLTKLKKNTKQIYRTDLNGTIKVISDGININIETEK